MRKLIIKYFALDYIVKIKSRNFNFVRSANIIFPIILLNGFFSTTTNYFSYQSFIGIILLIMAWFFAFVYFKIKPIKWEELDTSQKWQYGKRSIFITRAEWKYGGKILHSINFEEKKEWEVIDKTKNIYSPIIVLLINPIFLIITLLFLIL